MIKFMFCFFLLVIVPGEKVLFIGDSLTAYQYGWQEKLTKEKGYRSTNAAVGGKMTSWMIESLYDKLKASKYKKVFIYGGVNDIFSDKKAEVPLENIKTMIRMCKQRNVEPIVIAGYDPSIMTNTWIKDKSIEATFRSEYKRLQDSLMIMSNVKIIPPVKLLRSDSDDGIHLNSTGQKKFSEWIINHM